MRKPIIAGNWKMNKTVEESVDMVKNLLPLVQDIDDVDIVVCPTFTALYPVSEIIKGSSIKLGAQNMSNEDSGAFTGEISADMLKSSGCEYVIVGHSERREYNNESNELINKKIKKVISSGLLPILCVGEKLEQREAGITNDVVKEHVVEGLKDIDNNDILKIVIAYEPVWAIGTGKTATSEQAQEVHAFIRSILAELYDDQIAAQIRIQYGGSVKPSNVKELMANEDLDGALVGGASLDPESFEQLVKFKK
jgi:triosephosphate isomerase (TIM)